MKVTLNEQLERIKQVMGLINEQDDIMSNFLNSNNFRNCRGIRLRSKSDGEGDATDEPGPGWSRRAQKQLEKQMRKEEEAELKNFNKQNGLNLDMEYYTVLKDDALKVKNYNATNRYNVLFDESGKPFTKNVTQKIVNNIQELISSGSVWYFYWRDVFGSKTPTFMDLYKYVESIGGKEKYKQLVDANYNIGVYKTRLNDAVEAFETDLKSRFPFQKPTGKTPFYFVWNEGGVQKFRYFNTYEEWNISLQVLKQEGNEPTGESTDGFASTGSASFSSQPKKGVATPLLFK
jgi:hypothetical protein